MYQSHGQCYFNFHSKFMKQSELNRGPGNTKIGILLFVVFALIFSVTIVKLKQGSLMQGYDHIIRQNMLENEK